MGKFVGDYLQFLRYKKQIDLEQVSDLTGLSQSYLSMAEHGSLEISIQHLYLLVTVLNGDFACALHLMVQDAGIPVEVLAGQKNDNQYQNERSRTNGKPDYGRGGH